MVLMLLLHVLNVFEWGREVLVWCNGVPMTSGGVKLNIDLAVVGACDEISQLISYFSVGTQMGIFYL